MMKENTPQPAGRFAQARARYGRSTMAQLVIFVGLSLAANMLMRGVSTVFDIVGSFVSAQGVDAFSRYSQLSSSVISLLSFALSVGLLFLHRHVTFRSADRIVCTVVPVIGLMLLMNLLTLVAAQLMVVHDLVFDWEDMIDWFIWRSHGWLVIASKVGAYLVNLLVSVLVTFAITGTVHLARNRGKRVLCILPALSLLPLAFLSAVAELAWSYTSVGMRLHMNETLAVLFTFLLTMLQSVVTMVCSFFAYRKLIYRDTCDTAPRTVQRLLARLAAEESRPAPPTAAQLEVERLNRQQSSLAWQMEGLNRQRDQLLQQMAGVQAAIHAAEAADVPPAQPDAPAPDEHS